MSIKKPGLRTKPSFKKKYTTDKDFVINNCVLNSSKQIVGMKNVHPKYRNLKSPTILYVCQVNYKKLFLSNITLRTVAKICYEWHCKQNGINNLKSRYKRIIKYILGNGKNTFIEVVNDHFFREHTVYMLGYCMGSHALIEYVENDERIVLFTLFGVIWYKVHVCKDFKSTTIFEVFHQYSLDNKIRINKSNALAVQMSLDNTESQYMYNYFPKPHTIKTHEIKKEFGIVWDKEMKELLGGPILTRQEIYRLVKILEMDDFVNKNSEYYYDLFMYKEMRKIYSLMLLFAIASIGYSKEKTFFKNIKNWVKELKKYGDIVSFWNTHIVTVGIEKFKSHITLGLNILKSIPPSAI